ncbi:universal stress protein [Streptomyces sp. NPDC057743]|uniref:universal stress protein n=1 Tax=Streptomyces sp. NPDC057743 TaxID=3346236 RepID=UPI0036B3D816
MMAPAEPCRPVVVGVDGSSSARRALAWAVDEAARRHVALRLVHTSTVPTGGYRDEVGERVLKDAVTFARARQPQVQLTSLLTGGNPAFALEEEARDAAVVVLGSYHLSWVQEMFSPASVVLPLMAHARCPVVVVPEVEDITGQTRCLVVGIDGSTRSAAAADVAFEEAALHGAALRALYVRQPHRFDIQDESTVDQECRSLLAETVASRTASWPKVEVHQEVAIGHPVEELTKASVHALGLVVGTRGHGGFTGMLLGSVSQGVLHYASCPVIAVPLPRHPVPEQGHTPAAR